MLAGGLQPVEKKKHAAMAIASTEVKTLIVVSLPFEKSAEPLQGIKILHAPRQSLMEVPPTAGSYNVGNKNGDD